MTTTTTTLNAKLTKDEANLAAGIGAALAADLNKAIAAADTAMGGMFNLVVKAVSGRQSNMVKAIVREAKAALTDAGKAVGTVAVVCTIVQHHVDEGIEFPKTFKEARKTYDAREKKARAPRPPKAPVTPIESEGQTTATVPEVIDGTPASNPNAAALRILMQAWNALNTDNRQALLRYAESLHAEQALEAMIAEDAADSEGMAA